MGSPTGRKVVIAPSAKTQALGLTSWNDAASTSPSGRETDAACKAPERAICHAR